METYDEIYNRMKAEYEKESNFKIDEVSDASIRLKVLAGELYNIKTNLEWFKRQMFIETATGENLDMLAAQRGITRRSATKATGEVVFYISQSIDHDIPLPAGIIITTTDEKPIRFVTTETSELTAGNTMVSIDTVAEKAGSNGNVKVKTITIGINVPAEIEYFYNPVEFVDGTDEETDEELRERIKASYINLANGTNAAYYEQLALTVDGVTKAKTVGKVRGTGTVNVYICGAGTTASATLINTVQSIMNNKRELNVDVKVVSAGAIKYDLDILLIKKSGYTNSEVHSKCVEAFENHLQSIDIGGKLYLSALGKSLLDTGCIDNYEFNTTMSDCSIAKSQFFVPGNIDIEVT